MNWAHYAIEKLKNGQAAELTPHGNSMIPHIYSGEKIYIVPFTKEFAEHQPIKKGDIVLAKVKGSVILHMVVGLDKHRGFLIANAKGRENGWTNTIYGKFIRKIS